MISRRALLLNVAATALVAAVPTLARANASGLIAGAIRWDVWYGAKDKAEVEADLGPARFQYRAPWFATQLNANALQINGNSQANIDKEIVAANAAGLTYWAYDWNPNATGAPDTSGYPNAWLLHQSSSVKNLMNWCLVIGNPSGPSAMIAQNAQYVTYMQQSNYQKVLSGRPLFMWFAGASPGASYAAAITDLKTKAVAAGLGSPYVVVLCGQNGGGAAIQFALDIGADAISGYGIFDTGAFTDLTAYAQAQWVKYATVATANSLGYIPNGMMGSDVRPRQEIPPHWIPQAPWARDMYFIVPGTIPERVAQISSIVSFVKANPSPCAAQAYLLYSWDECDEGGGCLIPTLGDPPSSVPPYMNSILSAIAGVT